MSVKEGFGGCRLCLDPFVESYTTIKSPQLKQKMQKVFSFPVEAKTEWSSDVCQTCCYTITEFYQYSEKVRQNQETLITAPNTLDLLLDCELMFEEVKLEVNSDAENKAIFSEDAPGFSSDSSYEPPTKKTSKMKTKNGTTSASIIRNSYLKKSCNDDSGTEMKLSKSQKSDKDDQFLMKHFTLTCDLCGATSPTFPLLRDHFRSVHNRDDAYVLCCEKRFIRRYDLLNHVRWHTDPDAFKCELCQRRYKSKDAMIMHRQVKHPDEDLEHDTEPVIKQLSKSKNRHKEASDEQGISEEAVAEAAAKMRKTRLEEDEFLSKNFTMTCDLCGEVAADLTNLRIHFKNEHEEHNAYVVCCDKKFYRRCLLLAHVKCHVDPNAFQCTICQKRYKSYEALTLHKQTKHSDEEQSIGVDSKSLIVEENKDRIINDKKCVESVSEVKTIQRQRNVEILSNRSQEDDFIRRHIKLTCDLCKLTKPTFTDLRFHFRSAHNTNHSYVICCNEKIVRRTDLIEHLKDHDISNAAEIECFEQDEPEIDPSGIDEKIEVLSIEEAVEESTAAVLEDADQAELQSSLEDDPPEVQNIDSPLKETEQHDDTPVNKKGSRYEDDEFLSEYFPLVCDLCGKTSSTFTKLRSHYRTEHNNNNAYVVCCNKKFNRRHQVLNHVKCHLNPNAFQCELCQKRYTSREALVLHQQMKHADESQKAINLELVQKTASDESSSKQLDETSSKRRGMRDHEDEFISKYIVLTCNQCGVTKPTFSELRIHFRLVHGSNIPYVICCDEKIIKRCLLIEHLKRHVSYNTLEIEPDTQQEDNKLSINAVDDNSSSAKIPINDEELETHSASEVSSGDFSDDQLDTVGNKKPIKENQDDQFLREHFRFTCEICGATESTFTQLRNHFADNHDPQDPYVKCCGKRFIRRYDLLNHVKVHVDPDAFQCEFCKKRYGSKDSLILHKQIKHSDEYQQDLEKALFEDPTKRRSRQLKALRIQKAPNEEAVAAILKETESEKDDMRDEEDKFLSENFTLTCEVCGVTAPTFLRLRSHFRKVHQRRDAYVICCEKRFSKRCLIVDHIRHHFNPNAFKCDQCNKVYTAKDNLMAHKLNSHTAKEDRLYKCDHCSETFGQKCALAMHMERHQVIECPQCNKRFVRQITLNMHMARIHGTSKDNIFVCEHCGKSFVGKVGLERHITSRHMGNDEPRAQCQICDRWLKLPNFKAHMEYVHGTSDRVYECDVCHKAYPHLLSLQNHKKQTHAVAKFECEFCGKKFRQKLPWIEHRATHTGEVLYSCEHCGEPYRGKSSLYSHVKKKHPEEWAAKRLLMMQGGVPVV
ncbi:zinc finger protein 62 homolog [Armigeres subalbatus]|uniref:zinc finger protein 62 homolog n=1 Tax=Armigeres subalbatus TaxID=124917 RepID=UPI002ED38157